MPVCVLKECLFKDESMLVLSRKIGERILIGDNVVVVVVRMTGGTVKLGIEAPKSMGIVREELVEPQEGEVISHG